VAQVWSLGIFSSERRALFGKQLWICRLNKVPQLAFGSPSAKKQRTLPGLIR